MSTWQPSGIPPSERDPRPIGELLDRSKLTRHMGAPTSQTASTIFARWADLVGPDIAGHARPTSLHDGALQLDVDHPAWATQLRYMTTELLTRIAESTSSGSGSEVTEIHIRVVGQGPSRDPSRKSAKRGR